MQKQFKREQRYFVVKVKDAKEYLDAHQLEKLAEIADTISEGREKDGIPAVDCVVVESDWPEFEPTWGAIKARVTGAQPSPSIPEGWLRAIDEALVVAHIGVANESDTFEQAREKLDNLIGFHVDVASDPAVNGGWKLVPIEPMPSMPKLHVGYLPTINQDGYPALGAWWVQLWDGDDVFARVYGSSPEEAHNRAEMLAAAPEAKP